MKQRFEVTFRIPGDERFYISPVEAPTARDARRIMRDFRPYAEIVSVRKL